MDIYLPIAGVSLNALLLLGLGGAIGLLSGLFGVGGGFLMTPLLIFLGVPAAVAVGTGTNLVIASSVSGVMAHWRRRNVDFKMALCILSGGVLGAALGIYLFNVMEAAGQVDEVVSLLYVAFLGAIGVLMAVESASKLMRRKSTRSRKAHEHSWVQGLPFKLRFRRSKLYVSAIPPIAVGLFTGMLASIMGVGGGFAMVPALIYVVGMPAGVVIGTSLLGILAVSIASCFAHAVTSQTVDVILALLLAVGAVVGAQYGSKIGAQMRSEHLRGLLAMMVLTVCARLVYELVATPLEPFDIRFLGAP
jgi:uncharacterized membrane protein YfcA